MPTSHTIPFGQFRPGDSWLHRLDARAKFLPVLLIMILALLTDAIAFYLVLVAGLSTILLTVDRTLGRLLKTLRPILFMIALTILYHLIFTARDSAPLFDILGFAITQGGLHQAAFFSLRLMIFVLVAYLLTLTSAPSELAEGITRLLKPLERIRIPVAVIGLVLFMAIRFVPILAEEFRAIQQAQRARGVRFSGSLISRIRHSLAVLLPVFVAALSRADELAAAMEARGYRPDRPRTTFTHLSFCRSETVFVIASSVAIVALYKLTG